MHNILFVMKVVRMMCRRWCCVILLLGVLGGRPVSAADRADLIMVETGTLPLIISAPHGGKLDLPDATPRAGDGLKAVPGGFVVSRDTGTEELAAAIAAEVRRRFDKPAYLVVNHVHRKFCDPNRPPAEAYDSDAGKAHYEAYHTAMKTACGAVQKSFHRGLVIDVHGQGTAAATVYRGTQNGKTVTLLRERFGEAAHSGPESLFGLLKDRGWTVFPDPLDGKEQSGFNGGYIVRTYGNPAAYGLDAIQLEFGNDFRTATARTKTAEVLVEALLQYHRRYLQ